MRLVTADMQAELSVDNNETSARMVKARLEKTVLGQVTAHIKAVLQPAAGFISIRLDLEVIAKLQLSVTPHSVGTALLKHSKLKLKTDNIRCGMHLLTSCTAWRSACLTLMATCVIQCTLST